MPYPSKTSAEDILNEALQVVETSGVEGISLREMAARLGVTANALYRYFPNKEALVQALARHAANAFLEALQRASSCEQPERAAQMARAYLEFAETHPRLYELSLSAAGAAYLGPVWELVLGVMEAEVGAERAHEAVVGVWSYLHGYAQLSLAGYVDGHKPKIAEAGVNIFLAGFMKSG